MAQKLSVAEESPNNEQVGPTSTAKMAEVQPTVLTLGYIVAALRQASSHVMVVMLSGILFLIINFFPKGLPGYQWV